VLNKEVRLATLRDRLLSATRARLTGAVPQGDPLRLVRWMFLVFSVASAVLLMVVLLADARQGNRLVVLAAAALPCLAVKWFDEYGGRVHPVWWDVAEAATLVLVGVAAGSPLTILMLLYARLAFRGLVEPRVRLALVTLTNAAAFLVALLVLRVLNGSEAGPVAFLFLASGFLLVAPSMQVLGATLGRLTRAVEREVALRGALAQLSRAIPEEAVAQAAVDALRTVLGDADVAVVLALGPPTNCRVVAINRADPAPDAIGRPINVLALTEEQRSCLHGGGLQLAGDELAALWLADVGEHSQGLFIADVNIDGGSGGLVFVTGAIVPAEDRVTVVTLVEHIALRLEAASMSRELQIRRSDERLESLTRHTSDAITVIDSEGIVRYASPASASVLGHSPQKLVGQRLPDVVHPDDMNDVARVLRDAAAVDGAIAALEFRVAAAAGDWRHLEALGTNLPNDPDVGGVIVTIRDITDRRRMEEGLRESEANFRRLFEANPQPMWLYDVSTLEFLVVNDAAVIQYGFTREEFLAMHVDDICATTADFHASRKESRRRREAREETQHRTKDGLVLDVQVESSVLTFQSREVVLMLARDVTDERELHRRLEHQTLHDFLTGLPNRRLLETHVRRALARAEHLPDLKPAMLVLDLDGFKTINDTLGHALGDRVIAAIAERLEASLRPGDTASRLGGDEFAVLLEDTGGPEDAVLVAERLVAEIQRPITIDGRSVAVSASIGIALPHPEHAGVEDLVGDADIAMYVAKSQGTGCCVLFEPAYRVALIDRLTLQEELGEAVQHKQLTVHYQPQLELSSGRVVAVEALVRWPHPTRGMIPPDVFIPVGEQMGLVPAIDAWVMRTACSQLRQWSDEGLPAMRIAVNLSGSDLERADLVDVVRRALVDAMLDPWQLELELTESVAVGQPESAVGRLAALRAMGVRIAIDDFGTGYSMFSRLRDLPVDRLKIDRSFVTDMSTDDDARAIVSSTILMGHALGLDLVAEGVEDEATAAMLREMRCDTAQGYHFARPMPADELLVWLRDRLTTPSSPAAASVR
jgi:diguanylate cyclase (GGDEF)-like protein/PAS domain S-box-containing protein